MKYIIIDTNFVFHDYFLRGKNIMALCNYAMRMGYEVYMPHVVVDEMVKQYKEDVEEQVKKINAINESWQRVSNGLTLVDNIDDEKLKSKYEIELDTRRHSLQIKTLDYPSVKHRNLALRDLYVHKPFRRSKEGNIGYRDALIWESILEFCHRAHNDSEIYFISENIKDFASNDRTELHDDLKIDLKNNGFPEDRVKLVSDIHKYVEEEIVADLQVLEKFKDELTKTGGIGDIDVKTIIDEKVNNESMEFYISEDEHMGPSPFIPYYYENPSIVNTEVSKISYDVRKLSDSDSIITAIVEIEVDMDAFIYKGDLALIADDEYPDIINRNWNKHYVLVSDVARFFIQIDILTDAEFNVITSIEQQVVSVKYDSGFMVSDLYN